MEPPFYADLNKAIINMDESKINTLGPFAKALFWIVFRSWESEKVRDDAIRYGLNNGFGGENPLGFFSECFLLFKGAVMKKEWLYDWYKRSNSDESVTLQGKTWTSKSMFTALEFSKCD